MMILQVLKIVAALATAATGALALFAPRSVFDFTGLVAPGPRGISEIRAVLGGLFIALGLSPLFLGTRAYRMLGIAYLAIFAVRLASIFVDKSFEQSNYISLIIELVFGVILTL
jgi:uncharacterized membrane protein YeiH